ncbi:RNA polymerase subunit sigma-70 [Micractinium conductrix]|uniref:RNA polymerase subunit sigma-70 n=1 Tax=Micractinium conductrix TaxID=554055 RepID=A0A2P6V8A1_9CHLO|nr:RNA polymerase subunit sigma-70 [Micractinium conductrix]|eukprot:PSC70311.1 RNA polymerase subunit sigma-70 [Micractinium conductrix]
MAARAKKPGARFYCLDASACALLSEDFSGTARWHFQRELVACHSPVCLSGVQPPVALLAGSDGRVGVLLHPTAETGALQQALNGARPAGEGNLASSLKLALLVSRRFGAGSTHVTAFVASSGATTNLLGSGRGAAAGLCSRRRESLSRLGHLSSDGMMRPWLPTYSSLGKQAAAAGRGAAAAGGAGGGGEYCYIEVQPIPKWRTVLKVAAGRMLAAHSARSSQPGNTHADGDGGGGSFSAASSEMLRSLEEMMLDDEQQSGGSSDGGGEGPAARAAPAAVCRAQHRSGFPGRGPA